ncbi:Ger(x)C family spore germination protein [Bacillus thuringiensis]|uniref:Spore gernimation protein XA n=1 Tax=Bacillus thuringiensis TaxID=1428 RepID=A0A9W3TDR1_BACTU|nr:Ger(x)C family spore germination protein [Bacillus thuringiensis]AQY39120.1 spore gernimation protein XA [Bacillus thuringiensis]MDR4150839.1 Ger(x)C family spore germination protein [Bacillus thuringiensis]MEC3573790.1 Ger(x)C family spore germination protein [Bacillus thuringiensis]MED2143660.1 Ger(x)C family spore germination protein [Bacillus thuringiensis]MED2520992.1 Ger(x)C family spore germination protein [Bacillus thuringiensis]
MKYWLLFLILIVLLTGCSKTKILDDIDLIQVASFDLEAEDKIRGTFAISAYTSSGNGQTKIYSATGKSSKEILARTSETSSKPLELGQLRVIIFDKKLAKKGMKEILETMNRIPSMGNAIYIAIANEKGEIILNENYRKEKGISTYLSSLIEQNINNGVQPETNFYLFLNHLYDDARDSYLPLISKKGNLIELKGLVLFKKEVMIDTVLSKDLFIFKVLTDKFQRGTYQFHLPGSSNDYATIENIKSGTKYKMKGSSQNPFINAHIQVKGEIQELTKTNHLNNAKEIRKLEKILENEIEKKATKLIRRFINKETDPIGLKKFGRTQTKKWNDQEWEKSYKHLRFHVTVDVKIIQSGTTE